MEVHSQGHPRRWRALAVLCAALVIATIDNTVLNTTLPVLATELRASTAELQWINNAYTLVFASMLIVAGGLGARYGYRRSLSAGLLILATGSAAAALANGPALLVACRAVMGLGAAFVMPATLSIIVALFGPAERGRAIAIWSATAGIGIVGGPIAGGLLLERFAWGSVFWINVPLAVAALAGAVLVVPEQPGRRGGRFDLPGLLLSACGMAALVDVIVQSPQRGWLSATTLLEAGAAAVLLGAFVYWERRAAEPMIDIRMFAGATVRTASTLLAVTFFVLFGVLFVFTQYLQLVHGYSPLKAGLGALPFALSMAATAGTSNLVTARLGVRYTIALGLTIMAVGLAVLSFTRVDTPFAASALTMGVIGAGMGMIMAPASEATVSALPREKAPTASAVNSVVRELGGVLGIAVVGSVVSTAYRTGLTDTLPTAPEAATDDLPSAHLLAAHLPQDAAGRLLRAADTAFTAAMAGGARLCAAVALLGAVVALIGLARHRALPQPAD